MIKPTTINLPEIRESVAEFLFSPISFFKTFFVGSAVVLLFVAANQYWRWISYPLLAARILFISGEVLAVGWMASSLLLFWKADFDWRRHAAMAAIWVVALWGPMTFSLLHFK